MCSRIINWLFDVSVIAFLYLWTSLTSNKYIIIGQPYGRWGNRLMMFAYAIAWSKENGCKVINPSFSEYRKHFEYFSDNFLCMTPPTRLLSKGRCFFWENLCSRSIERIAHRRPFTFFRISILDLSVGNINAKSIDFNELFKSYNTLIINGFVLGERDPELINNHKNDLTDIFQFTNSVKLRSEKMLGELKGQKLVGICMRQGDYKSFMDGKFYLSDVDYIDLIKNLKVQFKGKACYFVASEESKDNFINDSSIIINCGDPAINMYILSQCDYLIGPPSTFLTWPAWYNDIPTCYVDRFNWNRENYSFTIPSF